MLITPSYSFTRPADTTQYGAGDLVANSTTAASVVPMKWSLQRLSGNGIIRGARINKSGTAVTAAIFDILLFTADPGVPTNGDNGAFGIASAANAFARITVDMAAGGIVGTAGVFDRSAEVCIGVSQNAPDGVIWGLLGAGTGGTYTPASEETFKVTLEIERST